MKTVLPVFALRVLAVFCTFAFLACDKSPTGPEPVKDPRTYTWTIDTLAYPGSFQTAMRDIWGSSPSDVYVVGHNDRGFGKMFHYDGKQWKPVGLNAVEGGAIEGPIDLSSIYGFASNDIWAVGERIYQDWGPPERFLDSSLIVHFDGSQWREHKVSGGRILQSIWGSSPFDIWSAGWNTVFHYNGSRWEGFSVPMPAQGIQFLSIAGHGANDVYMVGSRDDVVQPIDTLAWFLYHFDGQTWSMIDSVIVTTGPPEEDKFGRSLFAVGRELFSVGYGIFRKAGSGWERQMTTFWPLDRISGTSTSNLFAVGTESQVYHYNGSDWYRFPQFSGLDKLFTSVWSDGKEVFIVGNDGRTTYILRGR